MSKTPNQIAEEIVAAWSHPSDSTYQGTDELVARITKALTIPDNHVRLQTLEDVKVLGTLAITEDRCLVGDGATVWTLYYGGPPALWTMELKSASTPWEASQSWHRSFSTPEACAASRTPTGSTP